jgi:hypothetical protein
MPLLGIYQKECESSYYKGTCCTPMFIAALFTISKIWKQPRHPTTTNGLKNVVFIHNGILLSHKEEILSFKGKWMELENII